MAGCVRRASTSFSCPPSGAEFNNDIRDKDQRQTLVQETDLMCLLTKDLNCCAGLSGGPKHLQRYDYHGFLKYYLPYTKYCKTRKEILLSMKSTGALFVHLGISISN